MSDMKCRYISWQHQAITWTNVDLSSDKSHDIHLRALSKEDLEIPINETRLKIALLKLNPDLPGADELMKTSCYLFTIVWGGIDLWGLVGMIGTSEAELQLSILN